MEKHTYHYDAFISYRHNDLDKYVAISIHHLLETYKLPKNIIKNFDLKKTKIERVFRDQEELPLANNLEDPIVEALSNSEYLIVICSPRLKDSMWCQKEIETFIKLHGREKVLAVLVEGEPSESFPKQLVEEEKIINGKKTVKHYEPLALDVRGDSKKAIYKNIKRELLRLLAPMFNLNYDDLKRRHHERKVKRIITGSIVTGVFLLLLVIYMSINLIIINKKQQTILNLYSENLASTATDYLNHDYLNESLKTSYQALTKYDGFKMPYTTSAEYALSNSLQLYDIGSTYRINKALNTSGVVKHVKISDNGKYLLSADNSNTLILWNLKNGKAVRKFNDIKKADEEKYYTFIGNDKIAYVTNNSVIITDINGKQLKKINNASIRGVFGGVSDYFAIESSKKLVFYNNKFEEVFTYNTNYNNSISGDIYFEDDYAIMGIATSKLDTYDESSIELIKVDLGNKKAISNKLNASYIELIRIANNHIYILANSYPDVMSYQMEVYSVNLKDLSINWRNSYKNKAGSLMQRSFADGVDNLMVISHDSAYLLDGATGKEINVYNIGEQITGLFSSISSNAYFIYTTSGINYTITNNSDTAVSVMGQYAFNCDRYERFYTSDYGIIGIPKNDNRILIYTLKISNKVKETKEKVDDKEYYNENEIKEIIKKYNLTKEDLVTNFVYNNKKNIAFISYSDNTLDIYDIKNKKIINSITNIEQGMRYYLGTDNNGNTYLSSGYIGYVLNDNYEIIRCIDNLIGLDKKKNQVILSDTYKTFRAPIYTIDELITMAKNRLK